jgi:hypothetical protein
MSKKIKYFKESKSGGYKFIESNLKPAFLAKEGWAEYKGDELEKQSLAEESEPEEKAEPVKRTRKSTSKKISKSNTES